MPLSQGGGGSGGGLSVLFTSTLGAPAASFDTGAGGFSAAFNTLIVYCLLRSSVAAAIDQVSLLINNDSAGHYDLVRIRTINSTVSGASFQATGPGIGIIAGSTAAASAFSAIKFEIPAYANTVTFKSWTQTSGLSEATAANAEVDLIHGMWRSTSAINRLVVQPVTGPNFATGSSIVVYGTP